MKKFGLYLIAFLSLAYVPTGAQAQCSSGYSYPTYRSSYRAPSYNYYYEEPYYPRYVSAVFAYPFLSFPTYAGFAQIAPTVSTAPPVPPAAPATAASDPVTLQILALLKEQKEMLIEQRERIKILEDAVGVPRAPVPPPKGPAKKVGRMNAGKCTLCHAQGNEAAGDEFVLYDLTGQIVRLTNPQLDKLEKHIKGHTMPKINAKAASNGITVNTPEEDQGWLNEIARQRELNRTAPMG